MELPLFHPVRMTIDCPRLEDPAAKLAELLDNLPGDALPAPGARVALCVGSRKIFGLKRLVATLVERLKSRGLRPFIVPAMGSHGGATPKGQREMLSALGITEESTGAEIISKAEVVEVGRLACGTPVWVDGAAWGAEIIIPLNRVKPHTAFRGRVESGPSKMLAVGLGKRQSAETMHRLEMGPAIAEATGIILASGKVPFGVAVVENTEGATAAVDLLPRANWLQKEAALLARAWELYPRLPWEELDLLIVERMGKDISGTGMDVNVIGMNRRFSDSRQPPRIGRVVALELTAASGGNATGIGYANIVTEKLFDAVDWEKTEVNCRASGFASAARRPVVAGDERSAIEMAIEQLGIDPSGCRAVRVRSTSDMTEMLVTAPLLRDLPQTVGKS